MVDFNSIELKDGRVLNMPTIIKKKHINRQIDWRSPKHPFELRSVSSMKIYFHFDNPQGDNVYQ